MEECLVVAGGRVAFWTCLWRDIAAFFVKGEKKEQRALERGSKRNRGSFWREQGEHCEW